MRASSDSIQAATSGFEASGSTMDVAIGPDASGLARMSGTNCPTRICTLMTGANFYPERRTFVRAMDSHSAPMTIRFTSPIHQREPSLHTRFVSTRPGFQRGAPLQSCRRSLEWLMARPWTPTVVTGLRSQALRSLRGSRPAVSWNGFTISRFLFPLSAHSADLIWKRCSSPLRTQGLLRRNEPLSRCPGSF